MKETPDKIFSFILHNPDGEFFETFFNIPFFHQRFITTLPRWLDEESAHDSPKKKREINVNILSTYFAFR